MRWHQASGRQGNAEEVHDVSTDPVVQARMAAASKHSLAVFCKGPPVMKPRHVHQQPLEGPLQRNIATVHCIALQPAGTAIAAGAGAAPPNPDNKSNA